MKKLLLSLIAMGSITTNAAVSTVIKCSSAKEENITVSIIGKTLEFYNDDKSLHYVFEDDEDIEIAMNENGDALTYTYSDKITLPMDDRYTSGPKSFLPAVIFDKTQLWNGEAFTFSKKGKNAELLYETRSVYDGNEIKKWELRNCAI